MNITREKQIENLLVLHAVVQAQPESKLCLNDFRCGAVFCIGGLAAITPFFTEQGIFAAESGAPPTRHLIWPSDVAHKFFGDRRLFGRSGGMFVSHKAEALARIEGAADELLEQS
jgi:hypothetical protein